MFEKITEVLLSALLILSLSSCSQLPYTDKTVPEGQSNATDDVTAQKISPNETGHSSEEATAFTDVQSFMTYLVNYFHDPYLQGDRIFDEDILTLVFEYCYFHRTDLDFVTLVDELNNMEISGEDVRQTAKLLFGDSSNADDSNSCFIDNCEYAEKYDPENDIYHVPTAKGYWGGDPYYLEYGKELQISETDNQVTVIASVYYSPALGIEEDHRDLKYTFEKIVYDGFEYLQIKEVREI